MRAKNTHKKKPKRVGRGNGSGHGKTACRGHKGQRSRSGFSQSAGFEGGQNPIYRRLPKRGFNRSRFREIFNVINVRSISALKESEVTPETLSASGLLRHKGGSLKVLGDGEISRAVTVKAHRFSESAKKKIEAAGGKAITL